MASYCADLMGISSPKVFIDTNVQKGRDTTILLRRPYQFKIGTDYV